MVCYTPNKAFRSPTLSASGKLSISFTPKKGYADMPIELACGQCIGCRLERSRQWAVRAMHEANLYEDNCFLTLTYNDENLPADGSINKRHVQLFLKRLRKKLSPHKFRYIYAGEYGEKTYRPHYHLIIFNYDFPDKKLHRKSRTGNNLYTSEILDQVWGLGHGLIGAVTFESAAYVARYCLKKVTGKGASAHYETGEIDPETGEVLSVEPEFFQASLKPGIGKPFLDKYKSDIYPHDHVIVRGHKSRPPRAYDLSLPEEEVSQLKKKRIAQARPYRKNNTKDRLKVREMIQNAKINEKLPRNEV